MNEGIFLTMLLPMLIVLGFIIIYVRPRKKDEDEKLFNYDKLKNQNEEYQNYLQMADEIEEYCPNCSEIKAIIKEALEVNSRGEKLLFFTRQQKLIEKEQRKLEKLRR